MAKKWNMDDLPKPIQELILAARAYNKARAEMAVFTKANPEWYKHSEQRVQYADVLAPVRDWNSKLYSAAKKVR